MNRQMLVVALMLFGCLTLGCRTARLTRLGEIAGARSQAHDLVKYVKDNFQAADPEYKEAQLRYAALKAEYECWLEGLNEAIESGRNPALEVKYSPCPARAIQKRDDFVTYIQALRPRGAPLPSPNPQVAVSTSNTTVFEQAVKASGPLLTLFDSLLDRWIAFHDRYRQATKEERDNEISRLQKLHWVEFCENR
jgi:hypothetical protein